MELPTPQDLRERRTALDLTQSELADAADVSQPLIARIEGGDVDPRLSTLRRIVNALQQAEGEVVRATDLMNETVISVAPDDAVSGAVELMEAEAYSQLPVLQNGVPVGDGHRRRRDGRDHHRGRHRGAAVLTGPRTVAHSSLRSESRSQISVQPAPSGTSATYADSSASSSPSASGPPASVSGSSSSVAAPSVIICLYAGAGHNRSVDGTHRRFSAADATLAATSDALAYSSSPRIATLAPSSAPVPMLNVRYISSSETPPSDWTNSKTGCGSNASSTT